MRRTADDVRTVRRRTNRETPATFRLCWSLRTAPMESMTTMVRARAVPCARKEPLKCLQQMLGSCAPNAVVSRFETHPADRNRPRAFD